jgi:aromatic-L-amino-acid decarboxylase
MQYDPAAGGSARAPRIGRSPGTPSGATAPTDPTRPQTLTVVDGLRDGSDASPSSGTALLPLARHLLSLGGDERITVDATTGRNRYGTPLLPATDELWLSSSTASAISPRGLAAVLSELEGSVAGPGAMPLTAQARADAVRARLVQHFGVPGSEAILAASGTEAELVTLAVARGLLIRPLTNIVVAPAETGSGVAAAAGGKHFLATTSLGPARAAGTPLQGLEGADIEVATVPIRDAAGRPLPADEIDRVIAREVAGALGSGRDVVLHLLDCSKTGLSGVSRDAARTLAAASGGRVLVVVDACQLRASPETLRQDLADGFLVMITGSKFAGGPPFCGALLVPGTVLARLEASNVPPPAGLAAFSAIADWPSRLHGWCAGGLTVAANIGLILRWTAALAELDRYLAISPDLQAGLLALFAETARTMAGSTLGASAVLEGPGVPSIVPIVAATGPDAAKRAATLHQDLRRSIASADPTIAPLLAQVCHVGQPVALGDVAVLRICASAPLIVDVHERIVAGASPEQAFAPVAAAIATVFRKWSLLLAGAHDVSSTGTATTSPAVPAAALPDLSSPLDPDDWDGFARLGRAALDGMIDHLRTIRSGPVWRPMPADVRARFESPLPTVPGDLADALAEFEASIRPYATGNTHPMFMGWVHGAGTPVGMIAEMLAGGLNANCGGRDHVGIEVERQVTRWVAEMLGFPATASGVFVTGTSMANFLAVLVARDAALGHDVRRKGLLRAGAPLTAYASSEVHGCIGQALELAGIGSDHLRRIPVDATGAMDTSALEATIAADREAGHVPFLVVGTAGTVNTGAVDPLERLDEIARRERLWFHVDGAFGALAVLAPGLKPRLAGIERAQSIAFDFHKWAHVPYDAGFLLVRDPDAHRGTFASPAAYLSRAPRGLAAGDTWPCDLGPDLSRSFRALKTWMTLKVHGADRIGAAIEGCCRVARHLAATVARTPGLELRAPVALNIVCLGLASPDSDALVSEIVMDLHERGVAAPSLTRLDGRPAIRCAIVNHRTTEADVELLVDEIGRSLARLDERRRTA